MEPCSVSPLAEPKWASVLVGDGRPSLFSQLVGGVCEDGAPAPPAARGPAHRAAGALEPVRKVVTDSAREA